MGDKAVYYYLQATFFAAIGVGVTFEDSLYSP